MKSRKARNPKKLTSVLHADVQLEVFRRFRDEVMSWAEARGWPRLKDEDGFLVSRANKDGWVELLDHLDQLSMDSRLFLMERIRAAIGGSGKGKAAK